MTEKSVKKFSNRLMRGRKRIMNRTIDKNIHTGLLKLLRMNTTERNIFNEKRDQIYHKDAVAEFNAQIDFKH